MFGQDAARRFDWGRHGGRAYVLDRHIGLVTVFPDRLVGDDDLEALCADLVELPTRAGEFKWQAQALLFEAVNA